MNTKPYTLILLSLMFAGSCLAGEARPLAERQREFLSWKFGMFIHFGVASFNERQWATGHEDPASFAPTQLDCGQWADAAKAAGMKYVGFIKKQLTELLTGYGAVDLLWFDQYSNKYTGKQWPEIKAHVHSLQPNCLVLANNSLDFKKTDIHSYEYPLLKAQKRQALPSEENPHPAEVCDCITPGGWFWKTNMTEQSVTSAAEVVSMLKKCNSRQANYLLNVPPDRTGRIPEWLVARLREIGQLRQESEKKKVAHNSPLLRRVTDPFSKRPVVGNFQETPAASRRSSTGSHPRFWRKMPI